MKYEEIKKEIIEWLKEELERIKKEMIKEICKSLKKELEEERTKLIRTLREIREIY